jgi:hypothetical protein
LSAGLFAAISIGAFVLFCSAGLFWETAAELKDIGPLF